MGFKRKLSLIAGGLCMSILSLGQASASTVSYSGTLTADDQAKLFTYTQPQAGAVDFSTDSYGGGTSNGQMVVPGGFVPVLSLFDSTGMVIASDGADATCSAGMSADLGTNMCDDAHLSENLAAGTYTLAVTEFFNVPIGPNLSDGFLMQAEGNFTGATCGTTGGFFQTDIAPCAQRTNSFSVNVSTVPEPSTLWLGAAPFIAFGLGRRRSCSRD
jgi:hypothetical protein